MAPVEQFGAVMCLNNNSSMQIIRYAILKFHIIAD